MFVLFQYEKVPAGIVIVPGQKNKMLANREHFSL